MVNQRFELSEKSKQMEMSVHAESMDETMLTSDVGKACESVCEEISLNEVDAGLALAAQVGDLGGITNVVEPIESEI